MSQNEPGEDQSIKVQMPFSGMHHSSAELFAGKAREIEESYPPVSEADGVDVNEDIPYLSRYRSYVISSVISSVAFLEATINELYIWIIEGSVIDQELNGMESQPPSSNLDSRAIEILQQLEKTKYQSFANKGFVSKYQLFLVFSEAEPFDSGESPLQDINTIRRLRNYFTHFEPEWIEWDQTGAPTHVEHEIGSALQGKFELNPLISDHATYFPAKCLSYGCAEWSINTSTDFVKEFYSRLGLHPPIHHDSFTD